MTSFQSPPPIHSAMLSPIPAKAGVGLRHQHLDQFVDGQAQTAWVEIISENFFAPGGPRLAQIDAVRDHYPISCHGVGLSLGSAEGVDLEHLEILCGLIRRIEPSLVSDHLSFSVVDGVYINDLLPIPYTDKTLAILARNIDHVQTCLRRQLLIENPSSYLAFVDSEMTEWDFLSTLIAKTGCGLLLDVNNIYVSAENNGFDANTYLANIPHTSVQEIHVAGHLVDGDGDDRLLIDTHGARVSNHVWNLYEQALQKTGPCPTLIEWDTNIPELDVLLDEAKTAQNYLDSAVQTTGY